jgi:hypothetical protein
MFTLMPTIGAKCFRRLQTTLEAISSLAGFGVDCDTDYVNAWTLH